MGRGIVAAVVAVCLLANVPRPSSVHAAAAHPSIVLVKPRCYGHAPQTGSAIIPSTHLVVGKSRAAGGGDLAGFALYRPRAVHHWLQVEDGADASTCSGPWSMGGDGGIASYAAYGRQPPAGTYYFAVLYTVSPNAAGKGPARTLHAELSLHTVKLPLRPGRRVILWACTPHQCSSSWFRTRGGR